MQTNFSLAQLADPDLDEANKILRACVHCGFCNATCPTYLLLGDELDGPRGRIYLIKDMLENNKKATALVAKHIDRCLSCLACMTTCPSGVHYMHLIDQGRRHVEETYKRPLFDLGLRAMLARVLPYPKRFRLLLQAGNLARFVAFLLPRKIEAMLRLVPRRLPPSNGIGKSRVFPAEGKQIKRVALLAGCVQNVLSPSIDDATLRLLARHGCAVVVPEGSGCCGSIIHHMGRDALGFARANIDSWTRELETDGLDAIIVNASGCGTTIKDYGFLLREDRDYAAKAAKISALAKDVSEFMHDIGLKPATLATGQRVAYHAACSLQHGQRVIAQPKNLLAKAGFKVLDVPEGHICCGSAGTYNMLQPELANALLSRKLRNIESLNPEIVAAGNIGCITQIAAGSGIPVVHTVELLDWATGGPKPAALG